MSLLNTVDELKQFVSIDSRTIPPAIAIALREVEATVIRTVLGKPLADWLQAAYDADGFDADSADDLAAELLRLVQAPLGRLATAIGLPEHQVIIDGTGVHIIVSETSKTAFQWQTVKAQAVLQGRGLRDLDMLVQWLEDNYQSSAELQAWATSDAGQRHRRELFTSTAQFQEYENIGDSRAVFALLGPVRRRLEHFELGRVMGHEFLQELRDQTLARNLSSDNKNLLRTYVLPALASLTVGHATPEMGLKFTGEGIELMVARIDDSNSKEADAGLDQLLKNKADQALLTGARWLNQLTAYLDRTASATRFATYFNSSAYTPPKPEPGRDFTAKTYRAC
ncbi:hypothetical protein MUN81_10470 [Hymenobacter sp. 5317J-9]|uniref:DUF6712 family protein n=1 Tax=Hymenobacter sp. 5317J-9 TaxID=2932250 RepID=UPI001FD676CF|nr:DUF6712 family protein [Hymenobacter sp. 5317J-9]UOQ99903.1 hypothetical protein MUN81_10470 [Hymenobacter sp. 5317J-9]